MKILILRFSSLGDILLATPVLTVLKERWPDCTIEWVVKEKFLPALSTSLIDKIHTFKDNQSFNKLLIELKKNDFDLVFDLHRNWKSWLIRRNFRNVFCYEKREIRRLLLVWLKKRYPVLPVPAMYFQALRKADIAVPDKWELLFDIQPGLFEPLRQKFPVLEQKYLAFAPGASYFTKRWPEEYFSVLAQKLSLEYKVVLLGQGAIEEQICRRIAAGDDRIVSLAGKLSFVESAAVLKNCKLLVSNDSGLLHLGECCKIPVVGIFGSTTEELGFFPYATNYRIVENRALKCRPCSHFGRKKCPRGDLACLKTIQPEQVLQTIKEMIEI